MAHSSNRRTAKRSDFPERFVVPYRMTKTSPCPTCQAVGPWRDQPTSPFCSERCKMIDLGKWLGEEYRIASPLTIEDLQELEDLEEGEKEK